MASNFVSQGKYLNHVLTSGQTGFASGSGYLLGKILGVITSITRDGQTVMNNVASAAGDEIVLALEGVWTLPKTASGAIAVGARVYWDSSPGEVNATASGNIFCGFAAAAAADGATTIDVLLAHADGPDA